MGKSITVSYSSGNIAAQVLLTYATEVVKNVQTILCSVKGPAFPEWLQLRKFEMSSLNENNYYVPLFSEANNCKNMATVLFIDQVYTDIMRAENLKIKPGTVA